jgi:hypothetical protein
MPARENQFGFHEITNEELREEKMPPPNANWGVISHFALTFDGYKRWGSTKKCGEIANAHRQNNLDELRTCLFFEQRRYHHWGEHPDEKAMSYIWNIVEMIRKKVSSGQLK